MKMLQEGRRPSWMPAEAQAAGVQTGLTPGQETRPGYMPLDEFADEAVALFTRQPTPPEILVERVRPLRFAEAEGQFDERLASLSDMARRARADAGEGRH
ncbi:hypothetical protein M0638_12830 [Roseomonas sp. NAR14]|uniref:Uncharacterized protein n=1 Tax=Roseomonas acroporae TaxID=2937791 RepID=A0A9X1YAA1_9PROT|nr:hypothetical protein [Roseomonas acroporae]MCK8785270.1 hypothetical protein [Roseomonas acroporae]